jgi:AGZA family xanthine/uracil permease-like MFS transporter
MTSLPANPFPATADTRPWLVRWLDGIFQFTAHGSNMRREVLAGMTTFGTYSYILVVNPLIMRGAGMDYGALITMTALVAVIFTVIMGLMTNYPLGMAPGMGVNAMIAVQICQGMQIPWQAAIGMVFYGGVLFFLISVTGIRQMMIESFPEPFKRILSSGIGFFVALIGLKSAGILVGDPHTFIALGKINAPTAVLACLGLVVTLVLIVRKVPGALILSIAGISLIGLFLTDPVHGGRLTKIPTHVLGWPNSIAPIAFHLDFLYFWQHLGVCLPIVLYFCFSDLLSAMATLLAVCSRAGLLDEHGNLPRLKQALSADATAAMGAALLGSNTPIIYIESAAGAAQGGRTGLVSIVIAICFLLALFFSPVIAAIPGMATSPALVVLGIMMMQGMREVDLSDLTVAATALVTIMLMTLGSVGDGIALGFLTWVGVTLLTGKWRTVRPMSYVISALFLAHFIFM